MIEIELARDGRKFKENIVIRCTIKRDGNKSNYTVNGRLQGKKAVIELARSLSIQIDNLCQFLPQDKVVEFAAMTPIQLLRETQRAVASQELIDMHEELKDLRRKQKDAQAKSTADQDSLTNLESRQRLQEADVERMREREQIVKHVRMLEAARPFAQYRSARAIARQSKDRRQEAQNELTNLEAEVEPAMRAANVKEQYKRQIEKVVAERKNGIIKIERHADVIDRKFQDLHDKHNQTTNEFRTERDSGKKNRNEIARVEQLIGNLKRQMQEQPSELDVSAYNERIREKQRVIRSSKEQIAELQKKQGDVTQRGRDKNARIQQAERDLKSLESQAGKQNSKLQGASADTAKLWQWVQQHQDRFEKPVFGPPIVECSVKDPNFVDQIESLFQRGHMLSFTVQTNNDFRTFSDAGAGLNLSETNIRTMSIGLAPFRPPIGEEEMKRYGFDGWALDYLNGPEPVLAMLCAEMHLHGSAVAFKDTTTQQFDMIQRSNIQSWVTGKSSYRITRRREYGPGATSTQVRDLKRAVVWTEQPVDLTAKRELQENITGWTEEVEAAKEEVRGLQTRVLAYREAIQKATDEEVRFPLDRG